MPSSKASATTIPAPSNEKWLEAKANLHVSVGLEVASMDRLSRNHVVVCMGAFLASALGVTASVLMLCVAWLLPSTLPPPAEIAPTVADYTRQTRLRSVKRKKAVSDLAAKAGHTLQPPPVRPPVPGRHVSFHDQAPSRPPSPLKRPPTLVTRKSSPPPSPRYRIIGLKQQSGSRPSSMVSDDEAVNESSRSGRGSQLASPESSTDTQRPSRPATERKRTWLGRRKPSDPVAVPDIAIVSPAAGTTDAAKSAPTYTRTSSQLQRVESDLSTLAGSASADEHGSLASATTVACSVESARERGRFGWRLASKNKTRSSKSRTRAASQPRPSDIATPAPPCPPISVDVDDAARFISSPLSMSPTTLTPDESELPPLVDSASTASSTSTNHRRGSSASSARRGFMISPLTPSSPPAELCPTAWLKASRKTSTGSTSPNEKPARTQPYAFPYFAPPPEMGEWGVRTEDLAAQRSPPASR